MAIQIAKGVVPYPDPVRRFKVRRRAKALVRFAPWPGNDATPLELAQLCLVRSLVLQKQTHRAVRWHMREAAALLARSSVENTIVGLWCLYAETPMDKLNGSAGQAMRGVFRYLVEGDILKTELIDTLVEAVGGKGSLPPVSRMAETVRSKVDSNLTSDLYKRVYVPLSTFISHANGIVLMRHVNAKGGPRYRPSYPWHRRGPVRTADACLGITALAVSGRLDGSPHATQAFVDYTNAHLSRSIAPLIVMAGRGARGSMKWRRVPAALQRLREGARYYHSEQASRDAWEVRASRMRSDIIAILSIYEPDAPVEIFPKLVEVFVRMLVGEPPVPDMTTAEAGPPNRSGTYGFEQQREEE
jgi:hypothetical protein